MNTEEYRRHANKMIDFICDYKDNYTQRRVIPGEEKKANFMSKLIAVDAPRHGEKFEDIMRDFRDNIMPGLVNWNHPNFHAYFPSGDSYASLLGDMLSTATNQIGFSWRSSPALTEHELIVMNMYAKALDLPSFFLYEENKKDSGGGAIQSSASDSIMLALLTARARAVNLLKGKKHSIHESVFLPYMVAYTSQEAHSCVEKAAKIAIIKLRVLPTDERGVLHGETLAKAIEHDVKVEGFTPIFVAATVGTTGTCAFDKIEEIGKVCKQYDTIWYHVDGSYGGNSFMLPEMRHFARGLEYADSFNTNPNKLLLTSTDCACFWVRKISELKSAMNVSPTYLEKTEGEGEDLRHFGVPLSRRFRSLKLWFVFRNYGISGLQAYIRNHIAVAKHFASLVAEDHRFSLENDVHLGLICFRLLVPNASKQQADNVNMEFLQRINMSGQLHMVPTTFQNNYIIRFCVTNQTATNQEIEDNWRKIQRFARDILDDYAVGQLKFQREGPRALQPRFAFTRSVPRAVYQEQLTQKMLKDVGTATLFCEDDVCKNDI